MTLGDWLREGRKPLRIFPSRDAWITGILVVVCLVIWREPLGRLLSSPMGEGSPKFAQEWATVFQGLPDPQVAAEKYPEIATVRFASGEWLFAIDKSSHGHKDGGTIVIRDSCGKIRVFFGHVCGGHYVNSVRRGIKQDLWLRDVELKVPEKIMKARYERVELPAEVTLDDFYKKLLELKMQEYDLDGADQE